MMTSSPFSESFATWAELLDHVAAEYPLAYQAPLDARPVVITVTRRRDGKLRVTPTFSDAGPFTADEGHLSRFRRRVANPVRRRFADVVIGAAFEFKHDPPWLDSAKGPWIKLAARTYRHVSDSIVHTVSTVRAKVE